MKKKRLFILVALVLLLGACLLLSSCKGDGQAEETTVVTYTVTFDSNGGSPVEAKQVLAGELVPKPDDPVLEGQMFDGWKNGEYDWNFASDTVDQNVTLTASWISADALFSYRTVEGKDEAIITALKNKELAVIRVPSVIGGMTVVGIDAEVFADLSDEYTSEIVLPKTLRTVAEGAFAESDGIRISFEEGAMLTEIGERAFRNCNGLTRLPLGEGLQKVPFEAFLGCGLTELRLPSTLTVIEENAFSGCAALKTVMLYAALTQIQNMAFDECDQLQAVFFFGTEADADAFLNQEIDATNGVLLRATVYLYAETKPAAAGKYGYWYLASNGTVKVWQ